MWWVENDSEIIEPFSHFSLQCHCIKEQCLIGCKFWRRREVKLGQIANAMKMIRCFFESHGTPFCPVSHQKSPPSWKQDKLYASLLKAMSIFFSTCVLMNAIILFLKKINEIITFCQVLLIALFDNNEESKLPLSL